MEINLTRGDLYFLGAGLATVMLLSATSYILRLPQALELLLDGISTVSGVLAAFYIYRGTTGSLGGQVGKATALMGFGITYYTLTLIPHVVGHLSTFNLLPVYLFQHVMAAWAFVLVAYGSYKIWRGGQK